MEDHDWHMYDVTKHIEVRFENDMFYFRKDKTDSKIVTLNPEEFDEVRSGTRQLEGLE